jgi:hypothetical protein
MAYHLDFSALGLDFLRSRLEGVEPIPSQLPLLEGIAEKIKALKKAGIASLEDLSRALKGSSGPAKLALKSGIDQGYLVLLRRAIEGFRPKPVPLADFPGIDGKMAAALGIKDSMAFYEATRSKENISALAEKARIPVAAITELALLCGLCRIQWVGASYARLLHESGYDTPKKISAAKVEGLQAAVSIANSRLRLTRTEIGLKDSGRLIALAGFIEEEDRLPR